MVCVCPENIKSSREHSRFVEGRPSSKLVGLERFYIIWGDVAGNGAWEADL